MGHVRQGDLPRRVEGGVSFGIGRGPVGEGRTDGRQGREGGGRGREGRTCETEEGIRSVTEIR